MSPRRLLVVQSCVALACVGASALTLVQAQGAVPEMRSEGAVRYACGGIGVDESTAMRAAMKSHPLSLLFARADGAYLADVAVTVTGAGSAPVSLRAGGPVCLVNLPAGNYTVEASTEGMSKRQTVTVGGAPKTLDFRF
ncbi:carboxypeptidase regulatory-like domain-containing protein [Variovorax sp. LT1P1]|uniref:carboxypeptidase regulatory-like domain-containing protein n=1 Tax=Variovorax sp. LT1P1 TaxID=3443730 RepID=UPI003F45886C